MKKSVFAVFAVFAVVSIIATNSVFANDNAIVASKSYVDTSDNAKQDKITAQTTGNVVTYNGTNSGGSAVFDQRGIYNGSATYTNADANKLITTAPVHNFANTFESLTIPNHKFECANPGTCSLWRIGTGTRKLVSGGTGAKVSCVADGEPASSASECCSGSLHDTGVCQCASDSQCSGGLVCRAGISGFAKRCTDDPCKAYNQTFSTGGVAGTDLGRCCSGVVYKTTKNNFTKIRTHYCGCASNLDCPAATPTCNTSDHKCY